MSEFIEVRAGETIRRPIHEVRGQYGDIDHHIRHNVHPGITFTWVDGKDGTRLVRSEFSLLGMKQYDLTQFVDAPDGTLLLNHLEGANTGTVIEHRFQAIDDNTTEVQLVARVPASTGRKLLGPLFRFGVRQLLVKALGEDKKDLEGSGYRAGAAGDVEAAVGLFSSATLSEPALHAVLRAACLTSARLGVRGRSVGYGGACRVAGARSGRHGVASVGLAVAATIAAASRGIAYAELGVLKGLAAGGGLPDAIVESTLAAVEKALSA